MRRIPLRGITVLGLLGVLLAGIPAFVVRAQSDAASRDKILQYVRERFHIPATVKITMTNPRPSAYADFLETTVTVDDGKEKHSQPMFVSKNMRYLVEGSIFNLGGDPREEIVRLIATHDQPTQGPADAPVTLVEYSDLECPVCARFQEELETDIVPHYGNKLRVIFKEFPLVNIHDWAMTGAIAAQCVYQIDPSNYVAFRTAVYKEQESVSGDHARDLLLHIGAEAGVDNLKLATCLDAKASLPRVDADMNEGEALGVDQTPTNFVNGRSVIGAPPAAEFEKIIDEALHNAK